MGSIAGLLVNSFGTRTMDKSELRTTLEKVHAELANAESVDDDTRELLTALTDDLERLSSDQTEGESAEHVGPLSARVHDLVLRFETDHPRLTTALNQVADALANLGI